MFKNHRLEIIKRIIEEKKFIEVSALSEILGVSEVTVRRDLNTLEDAGIIVRSFGGATLKEAAPVLPSGSSSDALLSPEPLNPQTCFLGQIALQHIENQDFIYIGPGSESRQLAACIARTDKRVSVATSDIKIAQITAANPNVDTILTGGMMSKGSDTLQGELLLHTLERLIIKKAFISADGITLEKGLSTNSYDTQGLIRFFQYSSCDMYIMFSSDKAGRNARYLLGGNQRSVCLISDFDLPAEYTSYYFTHNIPLYTAMN